MWTYANQGWLADEVKPKAHTAPDLESVQMYNLFLLSTLVWFPYDTLHTAELHRSPLSTVMEG